jgi:hypothetical protein
VGVIDILFCLADHFEPNNRQADRVTERARVERWSTEYPALVRDLKDADGCPPRHTFFFPVEIYREELVSPLMDLCRDGLAEVEIHLHHDRDSSANLRRTLNTAIDRLTTRHGLLGADHTGRPRYMFIHGNWALDNALADGRHCGVDDELTVLRETGCVADFTLPAVPSAAQTRTVNGIYFAIDDPNRPRSHETGPRAAVGTPSPADGLMMVQGPLMLSWRRDGWRFWPRIDTAAIDYRTPVSLERFERWVDARIAVHGQPEWIFVKAHTHGAPERNADVLLGEPMRAFHEAILERFNDGRRYRLHYVTAREMANIAWAAIAGETGNPHRYRDYLVRAPQAAHE